MKLSLRNPSPRRGSVFITSMIMVVVLGVVAASVLGLIVSANRNSVRNEMRMRARMVAESELEAIFYAFSLTVQTEGTAANDVPIKLNSFVDTTVVPTTLRNCFLDAHRAEGWQVRRSMVFEDSSFGQIPNTRKSGWVSYVVARVEVIPPSSAAYGGAVVRVGRRFSIATASVFQYGIFYENDLEFNPGSDVEVQGDISSNKSIYMGSTSKGSMIIGAMVRLPKGQFCNELPDGTTVYRKPGTPTSGSTDLPPIWAAGGRSIQLEELSTPENLIGGLDANEILSRRSDLFSTINDVYRSLIVPPPGDTHEYPSADSSKGDDPTINAMRVYTKAGLRINIEADGSVNFIRGGVNVNGDFTGVVSAPVSMMDQREGLNVKVAVIDIAALKAKLDVVKQFNGILYVNQKSGSSASPTAIMLTNARETPETISATTGKDLGFSLATNGGIYIKGSFNTTATATHGVINPSVLMGDAVTLLSDDWQMANAASPIDDSSKGRAAGVSMAPGGDPESGVQVQVNAGVLTGNSPASSLNASGGAQNLIRYLERWSLFSDPDTGAPLPAKDMNTKIYGSLGCLFESKFFTRPFQQPGSTYVQPSKRYIKYSQSMRETPPAGAPFTYRYDRGAFFNW